MVATLPIRTAARIRPWLRDPHVLLALAIAASAVGSELVSEPTGPLDLGPPVLGNLLVQVVGHRLAARRTRSGLDTARLLAAIIAVFWMSLHASAAGAVPLTLLYIPIVTMAAAIGWRPAMIVGAVAIGTTATLALVLGATTPMGFTEASGVDPTQAARQRGVTMVATMIVLAIGARRTVSSLETAVAKARSATKRIRRQARQMAAVEEVGRLLAAKGPSIDALEQVMDVLVERFDHRFASIYTVHGSQMRLGAQRGYSDPIAAFDGSAGVIGRVMRTGEAALVPDVRLDPDYRSADPLVRSEVTVPLRSGSRIIGVLNVESGAERTLDTSDRDALVLIADRIASALALAEERGALAERAAMFGRLVAFSATINDRLDGDAVRANVVRSTADVLGASDVTLVLRDPDSGEDRVAAMHGADPRFVGARIRHGEGVSGRAIAERRVVTAERLARSDVPMALPTSHVQDAIAAAAIPLVHDERVIGALSVTRSDLTRPFSELEIETLEIIAAQVATTLVNATLHDQIAEAATRDPLTGLWNRRQLDVSLTHMFATRDRLIPESRRPVAAIMFDLDHFGDFNKNHGHSTGDAVLRAFGGILAIRLRSSDLVARYGGEEFIAVLDGATLVEATRIADDIRGQLERLTFRGIDATELRATVSAGCAALGPDVTSLDALLDLADVALQMAKRGGRNQVVAA